MASNSVHFISGSERMTIFELFVTKLPPTITEAVLVESFRQFGPVEFARIRDGREGSKIGFVRFSSQKSFESALSNPVYIYSHRISCKPSTRVNDRTHEKSGSRASGNTTRHWQNNKSPVSLGNKPDVVSFDSPASGLNEPFVFEQDCEKLFMTHVESPCVFWAQRFKMLEEIQNVGENISTVCLSAPTIKSKPEFLKMYGTRFSVDNEWYRCKLCRNISESQSEVIYCDYGNREVVFNNNIVELPDCLSLVSPLASKYCLYGVKATDDQDLFSKGVEKLSKLKEGSLLDAFFYESFNGITPVMVKTAEGVVVTKDMLDAGICVPLSSLDIKKINLPELSPTISNILSDAAAKQKLISPNRQHPQAGHAEATPKPPPLFSQDNCAISDVDSLSPFQKINGAGDKLDVCSVEKLKKELKDLQQENISLRNYVQVVQKENSVQKLSLESQLEEAKQQNSKMLEEIRIVQNQKEVAKAELERQTENTLAKKIAKVFSGIRNLSLLRVQFQSDTAFPDAVEEAVTLVINSSVQEFVSEVPALGQINDVRAKYQSLQTQLLKSSEEAECLDSADLERLITERNEARQELYYLLQKLVSHFAETSLLTSTETRIEAFLAQLGGNNDASDFALPATCGLDIHSTSKEYLTWKNGKHKQIEEAHRLTEMRSALVLDSLRMMEREINHRKNAVELTEVEVPNLDQLFDDYDVAIGNEIKLTSQEESQNDADVVQRTRAFMTLELRQRLRIVRELLDKRNQFLEELDELRHWLDKSPDLTQLQVTSKTIKSLKSKLRHQLADLQDIEEDGEKDSVEYLQAKTDLEEIQSLLQEHLCIEDQHLKCLSDVAVKHFPELIAKHPEFNLRKFIKYNGLLKCSHSLDQFNLHPLKGCNKKDVHQSFFHGKSIVLKEYLVGISTEATTMDFMNSVKEYSSVSSPYLSQLVAVFMGMNDRQAIVVLPHYTCSLSQLVDDNMKNLLPEKTKVLGHVLRGLDALHGAGLIHGAVHPNNVLIDVSLNDVVLADYDFTKTPMRRSENPYIAPSGLKFLAPELEPGSSCGLLSSAADMHNFGLLILWLHNPCLTGIPGVQPDLSSAFSDDYDMVTLVELLLQADPASRPSTDKILEAGYFALRKSDEELSSSCVDVETSRPSAGERNGMGVNDGEAPDDSEDKKASKIQSDEACINKTEPECDEERHEEQKQDEEERDKLQECEEKQRKECQETGWNTREDSTSVVLNESKEELANSLLRNCCNEENDE